MPFVDIATGAQLHYEDVGEGEPLVALHGRLGTGQRDFGDMLGWLAAGRRVLAPSLRGYGESTPKPRDFPPDFYHRDARDVLALLDALGIASARLIGFSDGGEVALVAAGMAPDRFRSVAVWGAVGVFGPELRPVIQASYPPTWLTPEEMARHGIPNADAFALGWIRAMKHMIDAGGDVSLSLAPNITCPVLLMLGKTDTLNPEHLGRRYVEATRNGRLVMFEGGHAIHRLHPDEFRTVLSEFLDGGAP